MDQKKLEECNLKVINEDGNTVDMSEEKKEELFTVSNLETLKTKFFNKTQLI